MGERKDAMARAKTKVRKSSGVAEGAGEEEPPHKKLNTGGGDSATDAAAAGKDDDAAALTSMTEMLVSGLSLQTIKLFSPFSSDILLKSSCYTFSFFLLLPF